MATFPSMAQDIMVCELCETSPVKMYCNICATNLCKMCIGDHVSEAPIKEHHVVIFKMRNTKPVFPCCETHEGQSCKIKCEQCDIYVCVKCITSGSHRKHDIVELMELCNTQKDIIEKKNNDLQTLICPKYEIAIAETENQIRKQVEIHEKLVASIESQGREWHREIDITVGRLKKDAEELTSSMVEPLRAHLLGLQDLQLQIHQVVLENIQLLQSNNVANIMEYEDTIPEFDNLPQHSSASLSFSAHPIDTEKLYNMVGSLIISFSTESSTNMIQKEQNVSSSEQHVFEPKCTEIRTTIHPKYQYRVKAIECVNTGELWACGWCSEEMIRFDINGLFVESFTTTNGKPPNGIAITIQGDLIYSDRVDKSIYSIRDGKSEKMIASVEWIPQKICSSSSGDLIMSMYKDSNTPKKIVYFTGSTEKQVIQFDEKDKPWFSKGSSELFIHENKDGDLCTSDATAKQVLVINQKTEKLRFIYTGNISSQTYKSFTPRGIVSDSEGQILVADRENHCIHILSKDGLLLRYIDKCKLNQPFDLSLDSENTLYVAEYSTSKVKLIKYR